MKNIHGKKLGKSTERILRKQHKGDFLAFFSLFYPILDIFDQNGHQILSSGNGPLPLCKKIIRRKRRKFGKILRKRQKGHFWTDLAH